MSLGEGAHIWNEPDTHDGRRELPLKNSSSARGQSVFKNRIIQHESELEHRVSRTLQARPDVVDLRSQFPQVTYRDSEGKLRKHVFDYWVLLKCGTRIAVDVKYERKRTLMKLVHRRIAEVSHSEFDRMSVMTEKNATIADFQNAEDILWSRDLHEEVHVDRLKHLLRAIGSTVQFWQLYTNDVETGPRTVAIWRLIEAKVLDPISRERITDVTKFRINL